LLAGEGLDAKRLALLARRLRRAEAAIEFAVGVAAGAVLRSRLGPTPLRSSSMLKVSPDCPRKVALRLLGRAIVHAAGELPLRLGRLEALYGAPRAIEFRTPPAACGAPSRGALITLAGRPAHGRGARPAAGRKSGAPLEGGSVRKCDNGSAEREP